MSSSETGDEFAWYERHREWIFAHRIELEARRTALIALVHEQFARVSREGGVSISEANAIDDDKPPAVCHRIRQRDTDMQWWEVPLPDADSFGVALSFMDPIGFHYHVPAYITHVLQEQVLDGPHCQICPCYHSVISALEHIGEQMAEWQLDSVAWASKRGKAEVADRISRFSTNQIRCIAKCLIFEDLVSGEERDPIPAGRAWWLQSLDGTDRCTAEAERAASRGLN